MKRFHVHLSIENLRQSTQFYSALFAKQPTVLQSDYAKWMVEDPHINLALSTRGPSVGLNHLGFQVGCGEELFALQMQLRQADARSVPENDQPCCHAKSDKYWVTDPSGIAWETFQSLGSLPVYGEDTQVIAQSVASVPPARQSQRCVPAQRLQPKAKGADCCGTPALGNGDECSVAEEAAKDQVKGGCGAAA